MKGAIAVVDDTGCSVVDKQNAAVAKGAVGLLVVSAPGTSGSPAGLFTPGYYQQLTVPVGVIDNDADAALRRTSAPVRLVLDSKPVMVKSRNVVAQTKTGDTKNVVLVGAHLDSVRSGPGINDNGSGVAAVLETAAALGSAPQITNAVRFAFWGSEEIGLEGSTKYVRGLARDQLDDIALYLNFDMLGSPNAGYFTYDGDQSGQPNPEIPLRAVPAGSAGDRTDPGWIPEPGRDAARRHAAGQDHRLQPVPDRRRSDRRPDHRVVTAENRSAGPALGWAGRRRVRPELPHSPRHHRQRRPAGVVRDGAGGGVRGRYLRAVGRGCQRRSAAGPAAPEYALATRVTNW